MDYQLLQGDNRAVLRTLPDQSVHCIVTSPPYYGLRDYGVDGQIGLEATPEQYVAELVTVFRECWRVLRDDGVLWLNLGDSYASETKGSGGTAKRHPKMGKKSQPTMTPRKFDMGDAKPKDLMGIPWMVAFALRADGWVLRSDVIWAKPNPMPESVTDRPTKAHEYLFLFSKGKWIGDMAPRSMNASDARWLALLIETEGNIAIRRYTHNRKQPQHAVQVAIANSDITILEEAQSIAGCGKILARDGTNRDVYYLQWTTKEAANLLWEVLPYMFGKRQQAICALYLESRRDNSNKGLRDDIYEKHGRHYSLLQSELELRDRIWDTVKKLNQHEPVDVSWIPELKAGHWTSQRYYYDAEAVKEAVSLGTHGGSWTEGGKKQTALGQQRGGMLGNSPFSGTRNRRSVWTVATAPYSGAHFATFPPALIEPCILAGTSEFGCCAQCGAPWERVVERTDQPDLSAKGSYFDKGKTGVNGGGRVQHGERYVKQVTGWQATCTCAADVIPCTVCDPFNGSGTTGAVACAHNRNYIGIDLSADYIELAHQRIREAINESGRAYIAPIAKETDFIDLPMFMEAT